MKLKKVEIHKYKSFSETQSFDLVEINMTAMFISSAVAQWGQA